jgi:hypothetical protein
MAEARGASVDLGAPARWEPGGVVRGIGFVEVVQNFAGERIGRGRWRVGDVLFDLRWCGWMGGFGA